MSDVTAVVLSIGEPYTHRAIASVERQTLPPHEILVVRNVVPGHRALNAGLARVRTGFFVEVDADMVLFPECFGQLRAAMAPDVGLVEGPLHDSLIGPISGVKMFRTECVRAASFRDTLSPDTDFSADLHRRGYRSLTLLNHRPADSENVVWHTFGRHEPVYTPLYTYGKYAVLGRRYFYRKDRAGYLWRLDHLGCHDFDLALVAQTALCHGLFLPGRRDLLRPRREDADFRFLTGFLARRNGRFQTAGALPPADLPPMETFRAWLNLGDSLSHRNDSEVFRQVMSGLNRLPAQRSWVAKTALCHGIFPSADARHRIGEACHRMRRFLAETT